MLSLVGFTPLGPAAGELCRHRCSSFLGPGEQVPSLRQYAAGGAFAILQSAAMGGYGTVIVNALAATGAATGACSIAAASFLNALEEEGDQKESERAA
jgi:hypothetical protein